MNEIQINTATQPVLSSGAFLIASTPFIHVSRTADFHVLIYVTQGMITVTEDDIDYEIHPGELFFLKSGLHHYGKKQIKQGTGWYYLHFYTSVLTSSLEALLQEYTPALDLSQPIASDEAMLYSLTIPKKLSGLAGSPLEKQLISLIDYFHSNAPFRRINVNLKLFQLLCDCAFYTQKCTMQSVSLADRMALYLQEHLHEPLHTASLEQHFYLSYQYMEAVFKKEKGISLLQYHTNLKIQSACKLLHSTLQPIHEISEQLGFHDPLYFSRCFKKHMGESPRAYRRKLIQY